VRDYGGRKEAPPAFLAAAKFAGLHTNTALRCSRIVAKTGRRCRHVAMKGTSLCLQHGGGGMKRLQRQPYVRTLHGQRAQAEGTEKR
jgi:hypothetical protein